MLIRPITNKGGGKRKQNLRGRLKQFPAYNLIIGPRESQINFRSNNRRFWKFPNSAEYNVINIVKLRELFT